MGGTSKGTVVVLAEGFEGELPFFQNFVHVFIDSSYQLFIFILGCDGGF